MPYATNETLLNIAAMRSGTILFMQKVARTREEARYPHASEDAKTAYTVCVIDIIGSGC